MSYIVIELLKLLWHSHFLGKYFSNSGLSIHCKFIVILCLSYYFIAYVIYMDILI